MYRTGGHIHTFPGNAPLVFCAIAFRHLFSPLPSSLPSIVKLAPLSSSLLRLVVLTISSSPAHNPGRARYCYEDSVAGFDSSSLSVVVVFSESLYTPPSPLPSSAGPFLFSIDHFSLVFGIGFLYCWNSRIYNIYTF